MRLAPFLAVAFPAVIVALNVLLAAEWKRRG